MKLCSHFRGSECDEVIIAIILIYQCSESLGSLAFFDAFQRWPCNRFHDVIVVMVVRGSGCASSEPTSLEGCAIFLSGFMTGDGDTLARCFGRLYGRIGRLFSLRSSRRLWRRGSAGEGDCCGVDRIGRLSDACLGLACTVKMWVCQYTNFAVV